MDVGALGNQRPHHRRRGRSAHRPGITSEDHADLALTVANQAAITMVNAELYQQAQALAALQERQRLAQNLHDAVNQSLFSAGLIAEVLPRLWDRDQAQARQSLEDLRRSTRGAMAEMRALLAELRPSTLTDSDLGDCCSCWEMHSLAAQIFPQQSPWREKAACRRMCRWQSIACVRKR